MEEIEFEISNENECSSILTFTQYEHTDEQIAIPHYVKMQCQIPQHSYDTPHGATLNTPTQQVRIRWENK